MFMPEGQQAPAPEGFYVPFVGAGDSVTAGGGASAAAAPFDIEGEKVARCGLVFGRTWLSCADTALDALRAGRPAQGTIYATVSHGAGSAPSLSVRHGSALPDNGLDATHRALYVAAGNPPEWTDVRGAITLTAMD